MGVDVFEGCFCCDEEWGVVGEGELVGFFLGSGIVDNVGCERGQLVFLGLGGLLLGFWGESVENGMVGIVDVQKYGFEFKVC